jgi:hypothetical protein
MRTMPCSAAFKRGLFEGGSNPVPPASRTASRPAPLAESGESPRQSASGRRARKPGAPMRSGSHRQCTATRPADAADRRGYRRGFRCLAGRPSEPGAPASGDRRRLTVFTDAGQSAGPARLAGVRGKTSRLRPDPGCFRTRASVVSLWARNPGSRRLRRSGPRRFPYAVGPSAMPP